MKEFNNLISTKMFKISDIISIKFDYDVKWGMYILINTDISMYKKLFNWLDDIKEVDFYFAIIEKQQLNSTTMGLVNWMATRGDRNAKTL